MGVDGRIDQDSILKGGVVDAVNSMKLNGIHMGVVRSTKSYSRDGKIVVYMPVLGGSGDIEEEPDVITGLRAGEIEVSWSSPFGGITNASENDLENGDPRDYKLAQQSYGMWMQPPDRNNRVLVCFISGNISDAYIVSCVPGPAGKQFMLPGHTGSEFNYSGGIGYNLPTTEKSLIDPVAQEGTDQPRPVYLDAAEPLVKQGLINDGVRGTAKHGMKSADTPQVYGILTPGPQSPDTNDPESYRLAGHSFVMDDTPENRHIRLRTGGGNQILMNDAEGIIYLINKEGTAWIELSKDGSINLFGEGSINMRAKGSFNLRADKDVNIEAGKNLKLKAAGDMLKGEYVGMPPGYDMKMHTGAIGSGGSVHIESVSGTTIQAGTNAVLDAHTGDLSLKAANRLAADGRKIDIISTIKNPPAGDTDAVGGINISSAGGPVGILGTTGLNLVGTAGIGLAGVPILLNSPPGAAGIVPQIGLPGKGAKSMSMIDHPDYSSEQPAFDRENIENLMPTDGEREELDGVQSIVSVMPTAEPYAGHYVSSAISDSNTEMMTETADGSAEADDETTSSNDPFIGYKTEIKKVIQEVTKKRKEDDMSNFLKNMSKINIPGIDLLSSIDPNDPSSLANLSNFNLGPLQGELDALMNYEGYLQGLLGVEFPINIPTVNSLIGDYVIGYGINLDQYMFDLQQLQMDFNGMMAEANSLMDMANNPMGMINDLANNTIGDVTKSLGIDNIKNVTDVSNLSSSLMAKTNVTSDQLNGMVNDVTNELALGGGDG